MSTAQPAPRVGIPLRPDPTALRRAGLTALIRTATAHIVAKVEGGSAAKIAERMFAGDRDVGLLTRNAVSSASTANTPALLTTLTSYVISALSAAWASAALLAQTLQLSFDGNAVISVPGFVADSSHASFIGEGQPIPSRSLMAKPLLLDPSKLATISALSSEIISGSGGNAEKMVENVLMRSVGLALDAALFDANAAIPETRPAGLRNGIAPLNASGAADPLTAMLADIATVVGGVAPVAGNAPIILVANPVRAMMMRLRSPRELPVTVLGSSAISAADLLCVAPNAIVSAMDNAPEISVSRETVLHMDDNPQQIVSAGTPPVSAVPTMSMFQTDVLALKCRMEATWARRDDRAVSWLSATGW